MNTRKRSAADESLGHPTPTDATLVFDGGTPDGKDGLYANGNFSWLAAATRFSLDSDVSFNGISWWGGYGLTGMPDADDDFTLDIFEVDDGLPGRLVNTVRLGAGRRIATGGMIGSLQLPEYRYSAEFGPSLLAAGSYFASLSNNYPGTGSWFWGTTSGGQQLHGSVAYNGDDGCWEIAGQGRVAYDLAFQLTLSKRLHEPSSLALLGLAIAGLASIGRRRAMPFSNYR